MPAALLVASFAKLCLHLGKNVIVPLAREVAVDYLVGTLTGEMDTLNAIDGKLERLVAKSFKNGLDFMALARNVGQKSPRYQALVDKARDQFIDARNVDLPLSAARASVYVGSCCEILSEKGLDFYVSAYVGFQQLEEKYSHIAYPNWVVLGNCPLAARLRPRRWFIANFIKAASGPSIGQMDFTNIMEIYAFMRPTAQLLHARGIPEVRKQDSLTAEGLAEATVQRIERMCSVKIK